LEQNVISFAGSKEITKENSFSRCTKFAKNQRLSLNFGNSSLRSSNSPKFFTLVPRFSIHKFHDAGIWTPPLTPPPRGRGKFASRGFLNLESGMKIRQWEIGVVRIFTDVRVKAYRN
jgi:hypothetical protein